MIARSVLLPILLAWNVGFSSVLAIAPADRQFWVVATILPVLLIGWLVVTHRVLPLSILSYILITAYLSLHTIGVHYTYAEVPAGLWLGQVLDLGRNHFDRIVHFSFGFLLTYPLEEVFRLVVVRGWLVVYLPVMTILGLSGLWEIVESWFAQFTRPELGLTILGSQGDIWDAQKDMTAAFYGSLLCILVTIMIRKFRSESSEAASKSAAHGGSVQIVEELDEKEPAQQLS